MKFNMDYCYRTHIHLALFKDVFCQMLGPVKRNNCMHSLTLFGRVVYEAQELFENAPKLCFN